MQPKKERKNETEEDTKVITSIPCTRGVSEKIRRICSKVGIKVMFRSGLKNTQIPSTKVKPRTDLTDTTGVVYCIPCMDCDCSYIGETCRTLNVRLKEHQQCCRNLDLQKSAVVQYAIDTYLHLSCSHLTSILTPRLHAHHHSFPFTLLNFLFSPSLFNLSSVNYFALTWWRPSYHGWNVVINFQLKLSWESPIVLSYSIATMTPCLFRNI